MRIVPNANPNLFLVLHLSGAWWLHPLAFFWQPEDGGDLLPATLDGVSEPRPIMAQRINETFVVGDSSTGISFVARLCCPCGSLIPITHDDRESSCAGCDYLRSYDEGTP